MYNYNRELRYECFEDSFLIGRLLGCRHVKDIEPSLMMTNDDKCLSVYLPNERYEFFIDNCEVVQDEKLLPNYHSKNHRFKKTNITKVVFSTHKQQSVTNGKKLDTKIIGSVYIASVDALPSECDLSIVPRNANECIFELKNYRKSKGDQTFYAFINKISIGFILEDDDMNREDEFCEKTGNGFMQINIEDDGYKKFGFVINDYIDSIQNIAYKLSKKHDNVKNKFYIDNEYVFFFNKVAYLISENEYLVKLNNENYALDTKTFSFNHTDLSKNSAIGRKVFLTFTIGKDKFGMHQDDFIVLLENNSLKYCKNVVDLQ